VKQVLQSARSGETTVLDVPVPALTTGFVLVRTAASLVSAGTERTMVEFAGKNLLQKAVARPDLVTQVFDKVRRDGVLATLEAVRTRLDDPTPLGYSAAGTVIGAGAGADEFKSGDRVACAGAGFANHAEVIAVPRQLCAALPPRVAFEEAAFTTVGAIALHGLRLANVQMGERVAVIGLGLLGQIAAQLAVASGCRVFGVDPIVDRARLAETLGADRSSGPAEAEQAVLEWCEGRGADAVLITADTDTNDTVDLAGRIARDRASVVAVGAVGMDLPRRSYFNKELRFIVSRSYGPGRYDPDYEISGRDYPIGYVRWTEGRNLAAFVEVLARGHVRMSPLITHRFSIEQAPRAYDLITGGTREPFLGVVLTYPQDSAIDLAAGRLGSVPPTTLATQEAPAPPAATGTCGISVLGAGAFARSVLVPQLAATPGTRLVGVASRQGLTAATTARRFGFAYSCTDEAKLVADPASNAVVVATRHNLHAPQALAAGRAGKHVFVEKPLCLSEAELQALEQVFGASGAPILMVGFNRRFAPLAQNLAALFDDVSEPLVAHYRVNAGTVPLDHWVHDPVVGGGRIVGEACHFVDFLGWLLRGRPVRVSAAAPADGARYRGDNIVMTIEYDNGAIGTVTYVASGDRHVGKERVEVHGGGRSGVLEDFRRLDLYRRGRRDRRRSWLRQDKGHRAECAAFVNAVLTGSPSPIPLRDLVATTRVTFLALESARTGRSIEVPR